MNADMTEEAIVVQLRENFDASLFGELLTRYQPKVFSKCKFMVKDEDQAKDLTQETIIKVYLKLNSFKDGAKFGAWILTIAENTCIDFLRKNKKKLNLEITREIADSVEDISELDEELPPEITMEVLAELMEKLTPEEKLILLLKYNEKLSVKEIQDSLDLGESAVKMRLKRAREKITKLHKNYLK
ncbi:RNA polymerase sigma factor [Flexithrix dorotheae]|uniref:RNA polymerase sigma factor n=1 Tax=Flexithrix dorotheae TaxID=70993 RepID=UPI000382D45E|nr:sigma-70 family RNA polymerase sigma factor [Flexithrix dorotheae]